MSDELIVRWCAPTLAAIKTGSLFACPYEGEASTTEYLRRINQRLKDKGIRAIPLRSGPERTLIYVYRPDMLMQDLADPLSEEILAGCGYPQGGINERVAHLMLRLRVSEDFPHEIGLFLGYPPQDVRGFITKDTPCKCTGLWKVYASDVEEAQRMFRRCRHCTEAYMCRFQEGWTLSRLTLQTRQSSYKRKTMCKGAMTS